MGRHGHWNPRRGCRCHDSLLGVGITVAKVSLLLSLRRVLRQGGTRGTEVTHKGPQLLYAPDGHDREIPARVLWGNDTHGSARELGAIDTGGRGHRVGKQVAEGVLGRVATRTDH